jgi:hypothetical protein
VLKQICIILICLSTLASVGRASSSKYQPGTITAVTVHKNTPGEGGEDVARYDVSVKIRNVVYVVLYTPRNGANSVEYAPGIEMLFLVGSHTLTFNSKISGTTKLPIVSREIFPPQSGLDWSKAPSQYFSMKQQHMSEALGLTEDQQVKIKPLLEQEAGEAGAILWTPVVSRKDRLKQYEKIVKASDEKIKPFLTSTQVDRLLALRKRQKVELKDLIAEQKAGGEK